MVEAISFMHMGYLKTFSVHHLLVKTYSIEMTALAKKYYMAPSPQIAQKQNLFFPNKK